MSRVDRRVRATAAFLVLLATAAPGAYAEENVFVSFEFAERQMAARFGNSLAATEQEMATWLIQRLEKAYPYWNFVAVPARGTDFPRIAVSLRKTSIEWLIGVALKSAAAQAPSYAHDVTWTTVADMERTGFPLPQNVPPSIKQTIETNLLGAVQADELFKALHAVPLVRDVGLANPSTQPVALPLDWTRHWRLGLSDFKVLYNTPAGIATVTCTGLGQRLTFTTPPPASGLVVQLQKFERGGVAQEAAAQLGELSSARPLAVFLTRFDSLAETLLSATGDSGIPSVAPPR